MLDINKLLQEKDISQKDLAKIIGIKERKLKKVISSEKYFSKEELTNVSAFCGVSEREFCLGVTSRKGEFPEVSEQNNINHYNYYIDNRFKKSKRAIFWIKLLSFIAFLLAFALYFIGAFSEMLGPPTLRTASSVLLCFLLPVLGSSLCNSLATKKVFKKSSPESNSIKIEGVAITALLVMFAVATFLKDLIPLNVFILALLSAVVLLLVIFVPLFEKIPIERRLLSFGIVAIPPVLLSVSVWLLFNHASSALPNEGAISDKVDAIAGECICFILLALFFSFLSYSLLLYNDRFITRVGEYFKPLKKQKAISRKKLSLKIVSYALCMSILCVCLLGAPGLFFKSIVLATFSENSEMLNERYEYITDFDLRFSKDECNVVEYEGFTADIPKDFVFEKKSEYNATYRKGEKSVLILNKEIDIGDDVFEPLDTDFLGDSVPEEYRDILKNALIKRFGYYPETYFEWEKLYGSVTLNDMNTFDPHESIALFTLLTAKAVLYVPDSEYWIYENDDLCAIINFREIKLEEAEERGMYFVSFCRPESVDFEYGFAVGYTISDGEISLDDVICILNSIEIKE